MDPDPDGRGHVALHGTMLPSAHWIETHFVPGGRLPEPLDPKPVFGPKPVLGPKPVPDGDGGGGGVSRVPPGPSPCLFWARVLEAPRPATKKTKRRRQMSDPIRCR
jgi:hypothetical protein